MTTIRNPPRSATASAITLFYMALPPGPACDWPAGQAETTLPLRPLVSPGKHYDMYHRAMRDLDRPRLFENRICYRLLDAQWSPNGGQLALGYVRYFDMIDVGEALWHELALAVIDEEGNIKDDGSLWDRLPFRKLISNPFDLRTYPLLLSISTLTISTQQKQKRSNR
jgi:hypothetical protein